MSDPAETSPPLARCRVAARVYRETGNPALLDQLRMDGRRDIAHALTMEHLLTDDPAAAAPHTAVIDAFLGPE